MGFLTKSKKPNGIIEASAEMGGYSARLPAPFAIHEVLTTSELLDQAI
jgi:hypothetical protein